MTLLAEVAAGGGLSGSAQFEIALALLVILVGVVVSVMSWSLLKNVEGIFERQKKCEERDEVQTAEISKLTTRFATLRERVRSMHGGDKFDDDD